MIKLKTLLTYLEMKYYYFRLKVKVMIGVTRLIKKHKAKKRNPKVKIEIGGKVFDENDFDSMERKFTVDGDEIINYSEYNKKSISEILKKYSNLKDSE